MLIPNLLRPRALRQILAPMCTMVAVTMVLLCSMASVSVSNVSAWENTAHFCNGWLDPAWTGTYRCDSPDNVSGYGRDYVWIQTGERAGCVDYADVWHNLVTSWVCYPKHTYAGMSIRQDGGWYRGVIRNNNLTYGGSFVGVIAW